MQHLPNTKRCTLITAVQASQFASIGPDACPGIPRFFYRAVACSWVSSRAALFIAAKRPRPAQYVTSQKHSREE